METKERIRSYLAKVSYRQDGEERDESFPVRTSDHQDATRLAVAYILDVLRLAEFELRIVGS
jgi:hypothetical protein